MSDTSTQKQRPIPLRSPSDLVPLSLQSRARQVWSHSPDVTAMDPYGGREVGWGQLWLVFEQVAQMCSGSRFTLGRRNSLIRIGSDLAYETGIEFGEGTIAGKLTSSEHRVTNIYRREAGGWKIVHRHTDLNPAEQDVSRRLKFSQGQTSS